MQANYDECLRRLLIHEGGYTNNPADPGGPTNFGITIIDYRKYLKPNATAADVKAMTLDEAKSIYKPKYWDAVRGDELPAGVDDAVFDYAVNSGVSRAIKVLQRCVGADVDGILGAETMAALARHDPQQVVMWICDERLTFLKSLKTWPVFGKGWGSRVAEVRAFSIMLASRDTVGHNAPIPLPQPEPEVQTAGKGVVLKSTTTTTVSKNSGKIGAAAAVGAFAWLHSHPGLAFAVAVLVIFAVLGIGIYLEARHEKKQDAPVPGAPPLPVAP